MDLDNIRIDLNLSLCFLLRINFKFELLILEGLGILEVREDVLKLDNYKMM